MLQDLVLDDHRTLLSEGQRFVYSVVRRLAFHRQLDDPAAQDRGVQMWLGLGNRGAHTACVANDA